MKGRHWIVLGTLFLLATSILLSGTTWVRADQGAPILVGAPIPRASAYGQNGERGMILAAEEINAAGGVKVGGLMRPLKLEIIDTRDEEPGVPTSEVLLSLEKLILQKKVDVVVGGPVMSECGIAAMDLFAKYKMLDLVSIGCFTPTWDQKFAQAPDKYKYSFRESGSVKWYIKEAVDLLEKIKKEHGFTKMYISIDDSLMCRKAAEIVEGIVTKQGWSILGFDKHPIGTTDYSVLMSNVKKSGAQVLFMWAYAPETSILLRQWADMEVPALPLGLYRRRRGSRLLGGHQRQRRLHHRQPDRGRRHPEQRHPQNHEVLQRLQKTLGGGTAQHRFGQRLRGPVCPQGRH